MAVRIQLNNGCFFDVERATFNGKIISPEGVDCGGNSTFHFTESEMIKLNAIVPLQSLYSGLFPKVEEPVVEEIPNEEIG